MLDWKKLLNDKRRKPKSGEPPIALTQLKQKEVRTEHERDYDRILFSTPVRRLADKTQVFPLEKNDSVRTRLTHSHEVSNLARSLGIDIAFNENLFSEQQEPQRNVPAILAAVGLAHDLGNPPFGHQGEGAIQSWVADNSDELFGDGTLDEAMKNDFLKFEGNAQTLRLLTRLQLTNDDYGLNLSYGTLAALMKYPVGSGQTSKDHVSSKKHGFFQSEKEIINDVWENTGLSAKIRHPLTYLMEACDDIAYSVLDAEDAVKKNLVSFSDLISYLKHQKNKDKTIEYVIEASCEKNKEFREDNLSPNELNDISMQMFRVYAIGAMISDVKKAFMDNYAIIMKGELKQDLIAVSNSAVFCKLLKKFDRMHAYRHRSVLEVELTGYNTIRQLMDYFWKAITDRENHNELGSDRKSPFSSYAYSRISENYRRVFESENNNMPIRYKELQLLTDMISGMTDSFAISLLDELEKYDVLGALERKNVN